MDIIQSKEAKVRERKHRDATAPQPPAVSLCAEHLHPYPERLNASERTTAAPSYEVKAVRIRKNVTLGSRLCPQG